MTSNFLPIIARTHKYPDTRERMQLLLLLARRRILRVCELSRGSSASAHKHIHTLRVVKDGRKLRDR